MCTRPRTMKDRFGRFRLCPCKTCIECRIMRVSDFTARLKFELQNYNYVGSFITLTYNDKNLVRLLPEGSAVVGKFFGSVPPYEANTLYRPDLSQFCDKMQKKLKRKYGRSGKYIGFGDYGDTNHRSHFHLIYIGLPNDRHLVYDTWNKGNVDVEPIGSGCIRYVLDYIQSMPLTPDQKYDQFGDFEPPFYHFSKGLGFEYIKNNINKFNEFGELIYGDSGKKVVLNPYLKNKFGFDSHKDYYPPSVHEFARLHKIDNLEEALQKRCELIELSNQKKLVSKHKPLYNVDHVEESRALSEFFIKYGENFSNIT